MLYLNMIQQIHHFHLYINRMNYHKKHKKIATLTGITQPGRYGSLSLSGSKVKSFSEKPIDKTNFNIAVS